jgi:hypothetical protein
MAIRLNVPCRVATSKLSNPAKAQVKLKPSSALRVRLAARSTVAGRGPPLVETHTVAASAGTHETHTVCHNTVSTKSIHTLFIENTSASAHQEVYAGSAPSSGFRACRARAMHEKIKSYILRTNRPYTQKQ